MSNEIGRRDFLGAVALAGAAAAAGRTSLINPAEAATASSDEITSSSASELAEAIRSKKWSSKAIVEAHLDRIAKVNPKLNAIVQLTAEAARKEADEADAALARGEIKGPLHGVPITKGHTGNRRRDLHRRHQGQSQLRAEGGRHRGRAAACSRWHHPGQDQCARTRRRGRDRQSGLRADQ